MPNANSTVGKQFELDVTRALQRAGVHAIKPRQTKMADVGDIHVGNHFVLQAKYWATISSALREGIKGAAIQAVQARRRFGLAVIKKPKAPILEAYVAMSLADFIRLTQYLDDLETKSREESSP